MECLTLFLVFGVPGFIIGYILMRWIGFLDIDD